MEHRKGYLNVEQLTTVIGAIAHEKANAYYCMEKCKYKDDEELCTDLVIGKGTCTEGDDISCRLYAEHIIDLYDNGFRLI